MAVKLELCGALSTFVVCNLLLYRTHYLKCISRIENDIAVQRVNGKCTWEPNQKCRKEKTCEHVSIQWTGYDHTRLHFNARPIPSRCIVHVHLSVFGSWLHPIDKDSHSPIAHDARHDTHDAHTIHSHSIYTAPAIFQINSNIVYQTKFIV